jgi:hypothetical protein
MVYLTTISEQFRLYNVEWKGGRQIMNSKGFGRSGRDLILTSYVGICLEGLTKTTRNLSQDSRPLGRDLNTGPSKYEAGVLTTQSRHSVS